MNRNKVRTPLPEHPWRKGYAAPSESNGYAQAAREKKAAKLVSLFEAWKWNSCFVARMEEAHWDIVSKEIHVKPPSEQTRALVLELLREREKGK